jgi:hypothetical protein
MALSKIKSSKQALRLKARVDAWNKLPNEEKISKKSSRPIFTKPGSNRK